MLELVRAWHLRAKVVDCCQSAPSIDFRSSKAKYKSPYDASPVPLNTLLGVKVVNRFPGRPIPSERDEGPNGNATIIGIA